jgi:hypothetical protein
VIGGLGSRMATGTLLDVAHLVVEPVVTVGVGAFTYSMARPVALRPALWTAVACVASFAVHRGADALLAGRDLLGSSVRGASALWTVLVEFSASALVFMAAPIVVYAIVSRRPPVLDSERESS